MPIQDPGLRRERLIKNVRLENRIELYREAGMGRAQIAVDKILDFFKGSTETLDQGTALITKSEALLDLISNLDQRVVRSRLMGMLLSY